MKRRLYLGRTSARLLLAVAVIAATSAVSIGAALADTVTPPPAEIPPTDTDFSETVSVAQFDPTLGTLISRTLTFSATVTGSMGVENTSRCFGIRRRHRALGAAHGRPGQRPVQPRHGRLARCGRDVRAAGVRRHGRLRRYLGLHVRRHQRYADGHRHAAPIQRFSPASRAPGRSTTSSTASGTSFANGTGGNIATFFASQAGATITITYEYQPPVEDAPAIDIEKSTNGVDADTPEEAVQARRG